MQLVFFLVAAAVKKVAFNFEFLDEFLEEAHLSGGEVIYVS